MFYFQKLDMNFKFECLLWFLSVHLFQLTATYSYERSWGMLWPVSVVTIRGYDTPCTEHTLCTCSLNSIGMFLFSVDGTTVFMLKRSLHNRDNVRYSHERSSDDVSLGTVSVSVTKCLVFSEFMFQKRHFETEEQI